MSIFDRFWAASKRAEAEERTAAEGKSPSLDGSVAASFDRRHRKRKNARHGTKALIIDDSATVVAVLRRILRSAGYDTRDAANAEQGLALINEEKPDLVFLDIILPGMNGFGALRAIRRDAATHDIPVIMISGNEHATEQFYASRIGADDFMKKPFPRFEVFARIETLLDDNQIPRRKGLTAGADAPAGVTGRSATPPVQTRSAAPATSTRAPLGATQRRWSALGARKELTAMGLQYFDQAQFFAAIRRADQLAVELFIASDAIRIEEPFAGTTALTVAQEAGSPEIIRLLRSRTDGPALG
ncbi:MAG: response regulator [Rhodoferax sp.]|uniref:response regulator n=1 Tax=Rhodoferax sp. TaxID=50421 RepID=UPI002723D653|nr:response regulator [Rhodoferax sp.]MDO8447327.1 response regulator [Rhodoferax sp.]